MPRKLRRVLKSEDAAAYKARRYTAAAPGKFRKTSKTISFRDYFKATHEKQNIEEHYAKQSAIRSSLSSYRSRQTRARNKLLQEYNSHAKIRTQDSRLIDSYLRKGGWKQLTDEEAEELREMFARYPQDVVRGWLGSAERSNRRNAWRQAA